MERNIQNTNINLLKIELTNLIEILDLGILKSESILKNKCPNLHKTSPTLFNYVIKNYNNVKKNTITRDQFQTNINTMFKLILEIQDSKISQYDASVEIGKILGKQYLPQI